MIDGHALTVAHATRRTASRRDAAGGLVAAAHIGLLAIAVAVGVIAIGSASGNSIVDTASAREPAWIAGLLRGIAPALTQTGFGVAMLVATAGYVVAFTLAGELRSRWLWTAIVAANVLLLLAPPLLSSDLFGYLGYARLGTVHHLNPYVFAPAAAPSDPVLPLIFWQHQTSPYGPVFTLLSYALGPFSPTVALWGLKTLTAAASVATAAVVWWGAPRLGVDRRRATVLVGLNPLLLVYAVGGAHNDVLVMLLLASGAVLLSCGRSSGTVALIGAAGAKVSAAIVVPFALVQARRDRAALRTALASLIVIVAVSAAVFGTHLFDQVSAIAGGGDYLNDYSGPGLLGAAARPVMFAALCAVAAWQLVRTWRGADWLAAAGWTTLAGLLVVPSLAPWYVAWLLPLAALGRSRRLAGAALLFTAAMVVAYQPLLSLPMAP